MINAKTGAPIVSMSLLSAAGTPQPAAVAAVIVEARINRQAEPVAVDRRQPPIPPDFSLQHRKDAGRIDVGLGPSRQLRVVGNPLARFSSQRASRRRAGWRILACRLQVHSSTFAFVGPASTPCVCGGRLASPRDGGVVERVILAPPRSSDRRSRGSPWRSVGWLRRVWLRRAGCHNWCVHQDPLRLGFARSSPWRPPPPGIADPA